MNYYDIIKSLYKKEAITVDKIDLTLCIILTNILKLDTKSLPNLKKIIHYLFFIDPKRYLMLLFIMIPQNKYPPFLKSIKKIEKKDDTLFKKIQYIIDWGDRELEIHKNLLEKVIDRDFWKKELGVK
uniref:Uncharacterized protein n=1 Tax=viral metagenome TaxID=1070528 RepID=A0A6M3L1A2_9ZZZZ